MLCLYLYSIHEMNVSWRATMQAVKADAHGCYAGCLLHTIPEGAARA